VTEPTTFKYRTNLARKMSSPGGQSIDDALVRAERGLERHRETAMATLAGRVAALEACCAAQAEDVGRGVYDQAAAVLDTAGFFETGPFYKAAFSLCELTDHMIEAGTWDWSPVKVHVQALRLILNDDCRDTAQGAVLLDGLSAIRERFTA
jgi:hypothetical protein